MSNSLWDRAERSVNALRTPDASLQRVPNTVRQSIADVIEELLVPAPAQPTLEPVAFQYRFRDDAGVWTKWMSCGRYHYDAITRYGEIGHCPAECRPLYAAQPPAAPVETKSAPAAPTGDTRSGERPPASAAMGHSAGAGAQCSAGSESLKLAEKLAALPLDQSHDTWPTVVPVRLTETDRELIVNILRAYKPPGVTTNEPQPTPHPDDVVNFNGRLVTWAEIDDAIRKRNAALSRPESGGK